MEFVNTYSFYVMRFLENGVDVYMIDRLSKKITYVNGWEAQELAQTLKEAEADKTNRYQFFIQQEKGTEKDVTK